MLLTVHSLLKGKDVTVAVGHKASGGTLTPRWRGADVGLLGKVRFVIGERGKGL